jgi:threonine/homoserine/homoserine lactone efflux protein
VTLAAIHGALGLVWLAAYAAAVTRARGTLERPRARRALERVTGGVLVAFGVRLAVARR